MMHNPPLDFDRCRERARGMDDAALHWALVDIAKTLPHADAIDRVQGTDNGGRYRDEASVYRAEIARRVRSEVAP